MQKEIKDILEDNFLVGELFLNDYYKHCTGYVISSKGECFIVNKTTIIDFEIASVLFIRNYDNEICIIATNKKFKRQGFANNLLICVNELYQKTSLCVRTTNKEAIALYNKIGYQTVEIKPDFYKYSGNNCDAIHMIKHNSF